jgi:DNA-binding XRE family transcriptional regulator
MKGVNRMDYTKEIEIMRHNLIHIRKTLGMSAKEFGSYIGVTRQTINSIEVGRYILTQTMYLAILYVLKHIIYPNCSDIQRKTIERMLVEKVDKSDYYKSLSFKEEG